jgi:hypothetical protein
MGLAVLVAAALLIGCGGASGGTSPSPTPIALQTTAGSGGAPTVFGVMPSAEAPSTDRIDLSRVTVTLKPPVMLVASRCRVSVDGVEQALSQAPSAVELAPGRLSVDFALKEPMPVGLHALKVLLAGENGVQYSYGWSCVIK